MQIFIWLLVRCYYYDHVSFRFLSPSLFQHLCRPELQGSLDPYAASVHEYKIPPKALRGLHSYCPVHFDAFHAVLVDTSIHISLLKASYHTSQQKVSRFVRPPVFEVQTNRCIIIAVGISLESISLLKGGVVLEVVSLFD